MKTTIMYQSAASGLWYGNPDAAGTISKIRIGETAHDLNVRRVWELEDEARDLSISVDWHAKRLLLLQKCQSKMREPERTLVCDILANGTLLPSPVRYGFDPSEVLADGAA